MIVRILTLELDSPVLKSLVCNLGRVPEPLRGSVSSLLNRLMFDLGTSCLGFLFLSGS